jgi:hypothetical protein
MSETVIVGKAKDEGVVKFLKKQLHQEVCP